MADHSRPIVANAWERWRNVWHVVYYGALLIVTGLALLDRPTGAALWVILSLTLLIAVGYWFVIVRHPEWVGQPQPVSALYFALTAIASFVLVGYRPIYFMFAFSLIGHLFRVLPIRWAMPGFVILLLSLLGQLAVIIGWSPLSAPFLITAVASLAFGVILALWIENILTQSRQRQKLIEELEATRRGLAEAERRAGALDERQRLAREIHDTLAQGFISVVVHLEAAESALPPGAEVTHKHIDQARQTARESLAEARRVIWAIRPELLERASLPDALAQVVTRWKDDTGLAAALNVTGTPSALPPEVEVTVLRAAQEALANIRKHAQATQANVTLSYMSDVIMLDVQDDGGGFDSAVALALSKDQTGGGFGLTAMRERIEQLGGSLLVESAPGPQRGTTLVIEIPLSTKDTQ